MNLPISKRSIAFISAAVASWFVRLRPLCVLCLLFLSFWIFKTRCNLRIVLPAEVQRKIENSVQQLRHWRLTKPRLFCAGASGCLLILAILGHFISGSTVVIILFALAAIVSSKYDFKIVKIETKDFAWTEKINYDTELDDEFMPEENESNLCVLERASNLATISAPIEDIEDEEKSDEIPSELLIPDIIPEIDENSTDNDEDDLVPNIAKKHKKTTAQNDKSTDVIEFKKGHFKRDSSLSTTSSSSEESLSKGLQFPDYTAVDGASTLHQLPSTSLSSASLTAAILAHNQDAANTVPAAIKAQTQALLVKSGKLLPSLVSGLVQWGMGTDNSEGASSSGACSSTIQNATRLTQRRVTALDSSDESDFEILENEDFK